MFMLILAKGQITIKPILLPQAKSSNRHRARRSRNQWMHKMNLEAVKLKVEFYAFRHSNRWWCCSALDHDAPRKDMPGDAREAAEMWLIARG